MPVYKAPGVYIEEISNLPPSVAEVATAVPAFIGYTAKAMRVTDNDLQLKPVKISSMQKYEEYFGGPQQVYVGDQNNGLFHVNVTRDSAGVIRMVEVNKPALIYLLYYAMKMFFDNGGKQCYVISVGGFNATHPAIALSDDGGVTKGLMDGLEVLKNQDDATLIVIPEATQLNTDAEYQTLVQAMLKQCATLRDRFTILDVRGGAKPFVTDSGDNNDSVADNNSLLRNRSLFGRSSLEYGAAYYPFIKTGINFYVNENESNVTVSIGSGAAVQLNAVKQSDSAVYSAVKAELKNHYVILPPSAAVAGVYVSTDATRGVWKAPANTRLFNVIKPVLSMNHAMQSAMNVDHVAGKSINAIRTFAGKGTLIWGARTLAGNDNEWRYISVRRLFNTVEESVKQSTAWVVFEANDANTWVKVRSMIENYLEQKWRAGALAGARPEEAYFVSCGLGQTMDSRDILDGHLNIEIGLATVRPAEFIIFKCTHLMPVAKARNSFLSFFSLKAFDFRRFK